MLNSVVLIVLCLRYNELCCNQLAELDLLKFIKLFFPLICWNLINNFHWSLMVATRPNNVCCFFEIYSTNLYYVLFWIMLRVEIILPLSLLHPFYIYLSLEPCFLCSCYLLDYPKEVIVTVNSPYFPRIFHNLDNIKAIKDTEHCWSFIRMDFWYSSDHNSLVIVSVGLECLFQDTYYNKDVSGINFNLSSNWLKYEIFWDE